MVSVFQIRTSGYPLFTITLHTHSRSATPNGIIYEGSLVTCVIHSTCFSCSVYLSLPTYMTGRRVPPRRVPPPSG